MTDTILQDTLAKHGFAVHSEFIPFSRSRNAAEHSPGGHFKRPTTNKLSLNWQVTICSAQWDWKPTRPAGFIFDYRAGIGHCPTYNQKWGRSGFTQHEADAIWEECESGRKSRLGAKMGGGSYVKRRKGAAIELDMEGAIECALMDCDVLQHTGFEDWADNFGYDTDSREAERIYNLCRDQAIEMFAILGRDVIEALQAAIEERDA